MAIALIFWGGFILGSLFVYWILDHLCEINVKVFKDDRR